MQRQKLLWYEKTSKIKVVQGPGQRKKTEEELLGLRMLLKHNTINYSNYISFLYAISTNKMPLINSIE